MRPPNVRPHYQGKDVDRIYEWLKRQRMGEYTNNFTKAGYDFPTIARMTPEVSPIWWGLMLNYITKVTM